MCKNIILYYQYIILLSNKKTPEAEDFNRFCAPVVSTNSGEPVPYKNTKTAVIMVDTKSKFVCTGTAYSEGGQTKYLRCIFN